VGDGGGGQGGAYELCVERSELQKGLRRGLRIIAVVTREARRVRRYKRAIFVARNDVVSSSLRSSLPLTCQGGVGVGDYIGGGDGTEGGGLGEDADG